MKRILSLMVLGVILCGLFAGCSQSANTKATPTPITKATPAASATQMPAENTPLKATAKVEMVMQDGGKVDLELYGEMAPITVANFLDLVNKGFYDGISFHRIIKGFMIQGGDAKGTSKASLVKNIKGEFANNGFPQNTLKHVPGVISMARVGGQPDSASSQFFIMHGAAPSLDGDYAAFGKVISGMDVVDKIANTPLSGETPIKPVIIKSIKVIK